MSYEIYYTKNALKDLKKYKRKTIMNILNLKEALKNQKQTPIKLKTSILKVLNVPDVNV